MLAPVGWGLAEGRDGQAPGVQQLFHLQLDQTTNFEERKLIRAALRELRQRKRGREPVARLDVAAPFLSCVPHSGVSSCPPQVPLPGAICSLASLPCVQLCIPGHSPRPFSPCI